MESIPIFSMTFDSTTALTSLYLWLLMGFLGTMVSCDFKAWMETNIWFRHIIGLISFFFLFAVIDTSNRTSFGITCIKTFFVYSIFLLMVKSKWYFSIPVLALLVVDQSIKIHLEYKKRINEKDPVLPTLGRIRQFLNIFIITIVLIGFIMYIVRQQNEFGSKFSWSKLLLHYSCKS